MPAALKSTSGFTCLTQEQKEPLENKQKVPKTPQKSTKSKAKNNLDMFDCFSLFDGLMDSLRGFILKVLQDETKRLERLAGVDDVRLCLHIGVGCGEVTILQATGVMRVTSQQVNTCKKKMSIYVMKCHARLPYP